MHDSSATYLTSEQLLFLSPWRPVETDTSALEGEEWHCLNCSARVTYYRALTRLEGAVDQFMVQCPTCDHLHVLQIRSEGADRMVVQFGGPHIDQFLRFLDRRNEETAE